MENYTFLIFPVVLLVAMYFTSIRPENKKRKEMEDLRSSMKVGDNVTTVGGIVGKIVNIKTDHVVFETGDDRVRIQVLKTAVSAVRKEDA